MAKVSKPESDADVLIVMQKYCQDKGYTFSDAQLDYMAQSCFFCYESKGWKGTTYWPPLAMRWVLNNLDKQYKQSYIKKDKGKTVRQQIMECENTEQEDDK